MAAAFVFLHGGTAPPRPVRRAVPATTAGSVFAGNQQVIAVRSDVAVVSAATALRAAKAAEGRHLAVLAAQRAAAQHAAAQHAAAQHAAAQRMAQAAAQPAAAPSASASPPPSSGGNAAGSALGICIRNAEEGGSYAWGPGNGGGAYQFSLGTWEAYGGAASEFGVAGSGYQDQIFDNAIAAGGASNWTDYDGC